MSYVNITVAIADIASDLYHDGAMIGELLSEIGEHEGDLDSRDIDRCLEELNSAGRKFVLRIAKAIEAEDAS